MASQGCDGLGDIEIGQTATVSEGTGPDVGNDRGINNIDVGQVIAVIERVVFNIGDSAGNCDAGQAIAATEQSRGNPGDIGNVDA